MTGCKVRELEQVRFRKKNKTGTLQEQITFNEARRGSSQIVSGCTDLHGPEKRGSIYRHVCGKLQS